MASLVVSGDTSGAITLSAPAVAGTNTLSLPAQTATLATLTTPSFATTIGVGGATAAASGAGITFPATQSASSNANTLDDYEEGTFTPTIVGTATAGTASYTNQVGEYTKIGNLVYFQINIFWSSGTGTGDLRIAGLPFTVKNNNIFPGVSLGYFNDVSFAANSSILALLESNNTRIYFYSVPSGGGNNVQVAYDAAGFIIVAGSYTT
jgi:hypothetical protein